MVRAVDIEGLLLKYIEENSLERADALYLLYTVGREMAARTMRARYGRSGAISSVLDDLKTLGVDKLESLQVTEDTGEHLGSVVTDSFKRICLDLVVKSARERANTLSQTAREILYLISLTYPDHVDDSYLRRSYRLLFQKTITNHELKRALDELIGCYVIQYVSGGSLRFPPYLEDLLAELMDVMPEVEVKVSWPKKEM
mgnify:CR=1 FL=1